MRYTSYSASICWLFYELSRYMFANYVLDHELWVHARLSIILACMSTNCVSVHASCVYMSMICVCVLDLRKVRVHDLYLRVDFAIESCLNTPRNRHCMSSGFVPGHRRPWPVRAAAARASSNRRRRAGARRRAGRWTKRTCDHITTTTATTATTRKDGGTKHKSISVKSRTHRRKNKQKKKKKTRKTDRKQTSNDKTSKNNKT